MPDQIRVLIACGPRLLRESLVKTLGRDRHLALVAELESTAEVAQTVRTAAPDVVVLDVDMPGSDCALVDEIRRAAPGSHILALTANSSRAHGGLMEAGVNGYLDYTCGLQDLVRCVERVSLGDVVVMAKMPSDSCRAEDGAGEFAAGGADLENLTRREREVLYLVAAGRTNAEIAQQLCISNHTVKGHIAKLATKLALQNRVQLAAFATQHGMAQAIREPVRIGSD